VGIRIRELTERFAALCREGIDEGLRLWFEKWLLLVR
jgi:hypothetical protein